MDKNSEIQRIYLVGFMGCGKSTLGVALAQSLGWQFEDLDSVFETLQNMSIPDYFAQFGEAAFRDAERAILHQTFGKNNVVFATGGGMPCYFDNMEQLNQNGLTVYIKLPPYALAKRLLQGRHGRPLVAGKTDDELHDFIVEKLTQREPFYQQSKAIVEDDGSLSVQGYVQIIKSFNYLK